MRFGRAYPMKPGSWFATDATYKLYGGAGGAADGFWFATVLALDQAGRWTVRWKGSGAVVFAEERQITVRTSAFPNP